MINLHTRHESAKQELFSPTTQNFNPSQWLCYVAVAGLIASSGVIGVTYGFRLGSSYSITLAWVFAIAALSGELLKPLAFYGAWNAARSWKLGTFIPCVLLAAVTLAYSLAADLSLSATVRGDYTAQRSVVESTISSALQDQKRYRAELNTLGLTRTIGELEALIDEQLKRPGSNQCEFINGPVSKDACGKVGKLKAEKAKAQRKLDLEGLLTATDEKIANIKPEQAVKHADPLAASLSHYAKAAGLKNFSVESVAPWLVLLVPLLLELGSSLGLIVAASLGVKVPVETAVKSPSVNGVKSGGVKGAPSQETRASVPVTGNNKSETLHPENDDRNDPPSGKPLQIKERGTRAYINKAKTNLVQVAQANGGSIQSGQRGLAKMIGVSHTRVNQVLKELAEEGLALVTPNRVTGTRVELMAI